MKAYVDTMMWIYHFDNDPVFGLAATRAIQQLQRPSNTALSSLFILSEVLVGPKQKADQFKTAQLRRFFLSSAVMRVPYTLNVSERFSDIRASTRIKSPDALHLAFAASVGADFFVTNDTQLLKLTIPGIGQICTAEQLQKALVP